MVELSAMQIYIDEKLDSLFTSCLTINSIVRGELPGCLPYAQPKELLQHDEKAW